MTTTDLVLLYDYDRWANQKLFAALKQLTPEQFTRKVAGSYGSIRNTLVHSLSAEWGWLDRCGGARRGEKLDPANYPTVEAVEALWNGIDVFLRQFLSDLTDTDISRVVDYQFGAGPKRAATVGELMVHAVIHAVHHRGQLALLLREVGVAPGNVDMLFYFEEKNALA